MLQNEYLVTFWLQKSVLMQPRTSLGKSDVSWHDAKEDHDFIGCCGVLPTWVPDGSKMSAAAPGLKFCSYGEKYFDQDVTGAQPRRFGDASRDHSGKSQCPSRPFRNISP